MKKFKLFSIIILLLSSSLISAQSYEIVASKCPGMDSWEPDKGMLTINNNTVNLYKNNKLTYINLMDNTKTEGSSDDNEIIYIKIKGYLESSDLTVPCDVMFVVNKSNPNSLIKFFTIIIEEKEYKYIIR